ncbi:PDZ domain-containing protein [Actinacidiphila cocklensis]|uniref:PDZ domain-containing protein n=1 Tax=Actinacidiphila cocklensis TaxID=887465 RepID=A0A9W4DTF6_9ACTN|nr:PDZ domain-containing protein [Actinacidiphila cocklensis]
MAHALQPLHERGGRRCGGGRDRRPGRRRGAGRPPRARRARRPDRARHLRGGARPLRRRGARLAGRDHAAAAAQLQPPAAPAGGRGAAARVPDAVRDPAEPASGRLPRAQRRVEQADGDAGPRAGLPAPRRPVGCRQAGGLRLRAVRCRHPPGRRPGQPGPDHRLAGMGHLRRRLLPARLRPCPRPGGGPARHGPPRPVHAAGRRTGAAAADRSGEGPGRPVAAHRRADGAGRQARLPRHHRGDDGELAVGAGQPEAEPGARPGGLHRDAPQDLRLRPDHEPVQDRPRRHPLTRGLPLPPGAGDGVGGGRLRLPAQRRVLVPEGDPVRGRDPQRGAGGAELPGLRTRGGHAGGGRPDGRADGGVPVHHRDATARALRGVPARPGSAAGAGGLCAGAAGLDGRHRDLAPRLPPVRGGGAAAALPVGRAGGRRNRGTGRARAAGGGTVLGLPRRARHVGGPAAGTAGPPLTGRP